MRSSWNDNSKTSHSRFCFCESELKWKRFSRKGRPIHKAQFRSTAEPSGKITAHLVSGHTKRSQCQHTTRSRKCLSSMTHLTSQHLTFLRTVEAVALATSFPCHSYQKTNLTHPLSLSVTSPSSRPTAADATSTCLHFKIRTAVIDGVNYICQLSRWKPQDG